MILVSWPLKALSSHRLTPLPRQDPVRPRARDAFRLTAPSDSIPTIAIKHGVGSQRLHIPSVPTPAPAPCDSEFVFLSALLVPLPTFCTCAA